MGLALACDLVIAADDAVFGTPEIDIGIWPYMVTVALLRSTSPRHALELMMTGRRLGASEAERLGLLNRVVPVGELDRSVDELAALLAKKPPRARGRPLVVLPGPAPLGWRRPCLPSPAAQRRHGDARGRGGPSGLRRAEAAELGMRRER